MDEDLIQSKQNSQNAAQRQAKRGRKRPDMLPHPGKQSMRPRPSGRIGISFPQHTSKIRKLFFLFLSAKLNTIPLYKQKISSIKNKQKTKPLPLSVQQCMIMYGHASIQQNMVSFEYMSLALFLGPDETPYKFLQWLNHFVFHPAVNKGSLSSISMPASDTICLCIIPTIIKLR